MSSLILASASIYRRQQMQQLNVMFEQRSAEVDESLKVSEAPGERAMRLAESKATAVKQEAPGAVVIGSDQVCACENRVYRKPGNAEKNRQQLSEFSGREVIFYTALCVIGVEGDIQRYMNQTQVQFRPLRVAEINRYVAQEQAFDCAGGFKLERLGLSLMSSVKSDDPSALVGLPLIQLCAFLRVCGFDVP